MGQNETTSKGNGLLFRSLDWIERIGNRLPSPLTLFFLLALLVVLLSGIFSGVSVPNPNVEEEGAVQVKNLFSEEGLQYIFTSAVDNFIGFAPLGAVLVTMLGIGLAEHTGLVGAALKGVVLAVPKRFITAALVFAGIMSSVAVNAGYVVLPPLGAVLFLGLGRHPIAGLAAAFAGVSGGFGANLLLTSTDAILTELTFEAIQGVDPSYAAGINVTMNYYFMIASVALITILGTWVTHRIVEPRLGAYEGEKGEDLEQLTIQEKKGLKAAAFSFIAMLALFAYLAFGPLRGNASEVDFLDSPFFDSLVFVIFLLFFVPGLVYGRMMNTITNDKDLTNFLGKSMASMSGYIALAFTAGQFIAYFRESNMGTVIAVKGSTFLESVGDGGFTGIPLILTFMVITMGVNLFIGSSSAKWTILAPVFVPMMWNFGYSPEFTTLIYRVADSSTNMITPLLLYFPVIIAFAQRYQKKMGIGTLIATMLPYAITFAIFWTILMIVWMLLGIPVGPDAPIRVN
ncbi:aminobenzoyl-glutamate transporter [Pontibacillus halophilus JSM 076056 = DSM 19796]|uniref:Aminobenzoyl-glutamate transporter n=1 Tax=Pontibacillus halophilus JSM 076056 = DSM 19796 TaxID=1385510 RepID=A0A0A5IC90_9BACI|nr:AbgT family transporter [Pontibacillus halophilus]KGX93457.1 aminobenzoyl-glutamate transporter [Pontibacillus halophilus JSM 076056 = DSM 19796]